MFSVYGLLTFLCLFPFWSLAHEYAYARCSSNLKSIDIACLDDFTLLPGSDQLTRLSDPTVSVKTEKQEKKTTHYTQPNNNKKDIVPSEEYSEAA